MAKKPIHPDIDKLRGNQKRVKRELEFRTAELEKLNQSLKAEIAHCKATEEDLTWLIKVPREISPENDFLPSVEIVLRRICERTGWVCGEAWVPSSDRTAIEYSGAWYGQSQSVERFRDLCLGLRFRPNVGLPGRVWASGQPEWVPDISCEPAERHPRYKLWQNFGFVSALGIPVIADGETMAVLVFFTRETGAEQKLLVEAVLSVATELALMLRRNRAELARRESQVEQNRMLKFNNAVMASMGEGLYTLDSRGLVTYVNPAAEGLLGWSSAELLGRKMHEITHYRYPDGRPFPADQCAALQALQKGAVLSNHEDAFIRKDGTFFPVVYSSSPLLDGEIEGLVVVFRDVTAQKQGQERLRRSREELRGFAARLQAAREEERTYLAREMHDELSGSLTALKMELALLPDRAAKDHALFAEKLRSMSALIDSTLNRVQSIVTELRPIILDKFGLAAAIEWQVSEFQDRSGIGCEVHVPAEEIPLDSERSTAVFRILQEALTNVARHAHANKVCVDLRSEDGSLILTVRDNGRGIGKEALHSHGSMGLLSMRERALAFDGKVEVSAIPAGGTIVTVRIPAK